MRIVYAGIEIQDVRILSIDMRPDYDEASGIDFTNTHLRLSVMGVVNPASTAFTLAAGGAVPTVAPGTRAGLTLPAIREALETPRQVLQIWLGPDLIISSHGINPLNGLLCPGDVKNGPLPHSGTSVAEGDVLGDRTVIVRWGCDAWFAGVSNTLLSNRWSVTHHVNRNAMTTRTIRGRAKVRADAISAGILGNADDFRAALCLPQPLNFRRDVTDVTVSEDGVDLSYTVVDKELGNAIAGANALQVYYFDGYASAGYDWQFKTLNDLVDFGASRATALAGLANSGTPMALAMNIFSLATGTLSSIIPRMRGRAMCRVEGGRNVPRARLAVLASAVCIDRVGVGADGTIGGLITSVYYTQPLNADEGQAVEVRMEWMPTVTRAIDAIVGGARSTAYMNMNNDYNFPLTPGGASPWRNTGRTAHTPLPNSAGTRGNYVRQMTTQALQTPGGLPANPLLSGEPVVSDQTVPF